MKIRFIRSSGSAFGVGSSPDFLCLFAIGPPLVAVFPDPLKQGSLEADVVAGFFRFQPLVLQYLIALG